MSRHSILARLVALVTLLGLAGLLFLAVIVTLADWRQDILEKREATRDEITRLTASIGRLNSEKQSFVSDALSGLVWQASQTAEATARVQSSVNDMARKTGIVMRSIAPTNAVEPTLPNTISFRLEFEASLDQLVPFLKTMEYEQPVLFVSRANLRRLVRPNQVGSQPDLFVQLDLAAPVILPDGDSNE